MVGDESEGEGIESLACEEGEGGEGVIEGSMLEGGGGIESLACDEGEGGEGVTEGSVLSGGTSTTKSPISAVIDRRSEKDALLNGISIIKAGSESNLESLLYEAVENLLDGNSEVSQSVSFDTIEERREESAERAA